MTPFKSQQAFTPVFASSSGGNYTQNDKVYSLSFTETPALTQNVASTFISVQPYLFGQFKGSITLNPQTDSFFSSNIIPMAVAPKPVPAPVVAPQKPPVVPVPPPKTTVSTPAPVVLPKPTTTVVSTYTYVGFRDYYYGYYWADGISRIGVPYTVVNIPINYIGFGYLNLIDDWYGGEIIKTTTTTTVTPTLKAGGSIQLVTTKTVANTVSYAGYYGYGYIGSHLYYY